ncbi:hypothetical protein ABPG75_007815 [Micractinium tetrahymenae]
MALPPACLLGVFEALGGSLADAVALSLCCKELYELGTAARRRLLCCAACGHAVLDAAAVFSSGTLRDSPRLDLPDSDSYATVPVLFCLRTVLGVRRAGDPGFEVRAREVLCGGCGLHLGLSITQLGRLRAGATAACISNWRELQLLGACFLGKRYLRLRRPGGEEEPLGKPPSPASLAPYRCTAVRSKLRQPGQCGAALFAARDILSRQHCWDAGDGPERAFYINAFNPGAVETRNERPEQLCQGEMRVADVYCTTCGARIGWKFCSDLSPGLENCNQVGRYGVVRSSIQKDGAAGSP